jgi:hypothetical protein
MSGHSVASLGARHPLHNWEYADATARGAAAGFSSADVGKSALQLDDNSCWVLVNHFPIVWKSLTGEFSVTENFDMGGYAIINVGNVDGRDVSADGGTLDSHVGSTSNPHSTSIANIGSGTLDQLNTALSDATIPDCDTNGNVDMGNQDIVSARTITFNSVPTVTPSVGTLTCEFDSYQKILGSLNNNSSVTIQLNTPVGPGNFMLILVQGGSTPTTSITWVTEGTHALYAPGGAIEVQQGVGQRTVIGLFYDGSTWYATATGVAQVLAS